MIWNDSGAMLERLLIGMYCRFSLVYDEMMADVDYQQWADYVYDLAVACGRIERVLDLACGTGSLAFSLANKGCDVTGVDISSDMVAQARSKLIEGFGGGTVEFLVQDMRMLDLGMKFDLVVCTCDGVNYLLNACDLRSTLASVNRALNVGGVFIFDMSSEYKLREIVGDNTFAENFANSSYIWENFWDEDKKLSYQNLTIFYRRNSMYERIEEQHVQKAHSDTEIYECLKEQGFSDIRFYDAFSIEPSTEYSERIFVFARKLV
jgi:ubiquinone/menaquinone biosynthesis C-methylase UbiE